MDASDPVVAPPPLAGPLRLHPFRPRGRLDAGAPALLVHEWTASGYTVRGIVGLLDLGAGVTDARHGVVLPHERVHPDQVEQLAQRMARGRVDPAPILLVHRGSSALRGLLREVCSEPPRLVRTLREQRQRWWTVTRPSELELVADQLRGASALLADGHHRYAAHRLLQGSGTPGADRALSVLVDHDDTPLHLAAVHRVVSGDVLTAARQQAWTLSDWSPTNALLCITPGRVVASHGSGSYTLTVPPTPSPPSTGPGTVVTTGSIPVLALDRLLGGLDVPMTYHHEADEALDEARRRGATALLLPAPTLDEVLSVVRQGRLLPEKATSFQPKPRPGLLTRRLRDV